MCSAFRKQIGVLEMSLSFCFGELKFLFKKLNPADFSAEPISYQPAIETIFGVWKE
jgi:hypothetical protein